MNHKFLTLNFAYYMDGKSTLLMHLFILKAILCELLVCLYRELSHASNNYQNRWSSWIISIQSLQSLVWAWQNSICEPHTHTHTIWRRSSYPESKHEIDESPLCLSKHWCADKPLRLSLCTSDHIVQSSISVIATRKHKEQVRLWVTSN